MLKDPRNLPSPGVSGRRQLQSFDRATGMITSMCMIGCKHHRPNDEFIRECLVKLSKHGNIPRRLIAEFCGMTFDEFSQCTRKGRKVNTQLATIIWMIYARWFHPEWLDNYVSMFTWGSFVGFDHSGNWHRAPKPVETKPVKFNFHIKSILDNKQTLSQEDTTQQKQTGARTSEV